MNNVYSLMKIAKVLWELLDKMHKVEDIGLNKFIVKDFEHEDGRFHIHDDRNPKFANNNIVESFMPRE